MSLICEGYDSPSRNVGIYVTNSNLKDIHYRQPSPQKLPWLIKIYDDGEISEKRRNEPERTKKLYGIRSLLAFEKDSDSFDSSSCSEEEPRLPSISDRDSTVKMAENKSSDIASEEMEKEHKNASDNRKKIRTYTAEFKKKTAEEAVVSDQLTRFAKDRGIPLSTLYGWIKTYEPTFQGKKSRNKKKIVENEDKEEKETIQTSEEVVSQEEEFVDSNKRRTRKNKNFLKKLIDEIE